MDTITLEVKTRDAGSAREIRTQGAIPCNYYGGDKENQVFAVDYQTFRRVFEKAGGNTVLELDIDGKEKTNVLVHDVDYDPVSDEYTHIDFKFVDLNKEVTADVPLIAIGESSAVRDEGGRLMQNRNTLTIKCIARILPSELEFDISVLEDFQSSIHVGDIKLPEGVVAVDDEGLTIATVIAPREEEVIEVEEPEEGEDGETGEGGEAGEGGEEKKEEGGDSKAKEGGDDKKE